MNRKAMLIISIIATIFMPILLPIPVIILINNNRIGKNLDKISFGNGILISLGIYGGMFALTIILALAVGSSDTTTENSSAIATTEAATEIISVEEVTKETELISIDNTATNATTEESVQTEEAIIEEAPIVTEKSKDIIYNLEELMNEAIEVDYKDLLRYPDEYINKIIVFDAYVDFAYAKENYYSVSQLNRSSIEVSDYFWDLYNRTNDSYFIYNPSYDVIVNVPPTFYDYCPEKLVNDDCATIIGRFNGLELTTDGDEIPSIDLYLTILME